MLNGHCAAIVTEDARPPRLSRPHLSWLPRLIKARSSTSRFARDSLLEEAVCCELVSEMELGKSRFLGFRRKMDLFPKRSAFLSDCYYTHFSNAGIAAAADFPV